MALEHGVKRCALRSQAIRDGKEAIQFFDALTQFPGAPPQRRLYPAHLSHLLPQIADLVVGFLQRLYEFGL